MQEYNHKAIEEKWRQEWLKNQTFKTLDKVDNRENEYILCEFPYPSGNLHVGHWYAFAVTDIYAKYKRLLGKNVLFPIGFDSFGLPAENAAIKHGLDPKVWTYQNIETMKNQMVSMGASFDWDRMVVASDPEYYKWTQWIFTQMFEKGLAHKKKAVVNWDPVDKTVLANEQVLADGTAERSGAIVEKKEIEQWFLKITDYAERLNNDLDELNWPEEIKNQQRNWIGKSEGSEIEFDIFGAEEKIKVFTTRADTLFGATYVVLAPEHELIQKMADRISNIEEVSKYIEEAKNKKEIERTKIEKNKTGVELIGLKAINPANKKEIPIFIADYVLASYGTGAVMAVPAHDERDYAFAQKYKLPINYVISKDGKNEMQDCYIEDGILIDSGDFSGLNSEEARQKITEFVGGQMKTTYKLRDWSVGRQRYWGCPIPIVYDPEGKPHSIPKEHLPWQLPTDVDYKPTGEPPLAKSKELKERTETIFGKGWKPEVETLDTFVDSSWYFLRYLDPKNNNDLASADKIKNWMPVNFYSGGAEHTNLHLLYSRFFYKFLFDIGIVKEKEPYQIRLNRGLILGPDGNKMSKSKGNVINPDEIVDRLGADTVRLYLAFIGPYNEPGSYPWDPNGVVGVRRFLERVWKISEKLSDDSSDKIILEINKLIKKASIDFSELKFNTIVASMMTFVNHAEKEKVSKSDFLKFLIILAPFAPHFSEELFANLVNANSTETIFNQKMPNFDESIINQEGKVIGIQVNGKVRSEILVNESDTEEILKEKVLNLPEIQKWIEGKNMAKFIYVQGKIISIVLN